MGNPKILFLCPQPLWPTNTGARLRNFHLANALTSSCQVDVLQLQAPGEAAFKVPPNNFSKVVTAVRGSSYTPTKLLRGFIGPYPANVLNYSSNAVARTLDGLLRSRHYSALQMESIHLFPYWSVIQQQPHTPAVFLDWHNIESELMEQYAQNSKNLPRKLVGGRTAHLLHQLENKALQSLSAHLVVSEPEQAKLLSRAPKAQIQLIPNGVDSVAFQNLRPWSRDRETLLFVGSMDYHANSDAVFWFAQTIWPQVTDHFPDLKFEIVGRNPPLLIRNLASTRVTVTGTVEDVRPYYEKALALVVPLRVGGGTRLKILEGMAAGVPVISTTLGAEGIKAEDGRHIVIAEDGAAFSRAIARLRTEPGFSEALRGSARALVRTDYDWSVLSKKLAQRYIELAKI